ncbi:hypothetical protein EV714DRAFT_287779 [Schizophyllum commune]
MDQIAALEAEVVTTCLEHKPVRVGTEFFVKFGHSSDLGPEIETQRYISDHAMTNPGRGVPRIPRMLHSFERDGTTYLVMEFINLVPTPEDFIDKVTAALMWLASVPAPPDHVLGPLGGGRIRHGLFKDARAPLPFSSVGALERIHPSLIHNLGQAYTLLSSTTRRTVSPVQIQGRRLLFSQNDMDDSNFGVDEHGNLVLLDFAEIGWTPEALVAQTMFSKPRLAPVAAALGLSNEYCTSMSHISSVLKMVGRPKLGLDENGNPQATSVG